MAEFHDEGRSYQVCKFFVDYDVGCVYEVRQCLPVN